MLTIIIVLAALIAIVSMDGSWSNVLQSNRNDLVFAERNMEYGAYKLRREYHRNLIVALFLSTLTIGGICTALFFAGSNLETIIPPNDPVEILDITPVTLDDEEIPEKPEKIKIQPKKVATIDNREVEIVDKEKADIAKSQEEKKDKLSGSSDEEGEEMPFPPDNGLGKGDEKVEKQEPEKWVDQLPEFPGGEPALQKYLKQNIGYTKADIDQHLEGTIWITFVVLKSGEIGEVTVERAFRGGDALAKKCVRAIEKMPIWKPGKLRGKEVNYVHHIPVSFRID